MPALFNLWKDGLLGEGSSIIGYARSDKTDEVFRKEVGGMIEDDRWADF